MILKHSVARFLLEDSSCRPDMEILGHMLELKGCFEACCHTHLSLQPPYYEIDKAKTIRKTDFILELQNNNNQEKHIINTILSLDKDQEKARINTVVQHIMGHKVQIQKSKSPKNKRTREQNNRPSNQPKTCSWPNHSIHHHFHHFRHFHCFPQLGPLDQRRFPHSRRFVVSRYSRRFHCLHSRKVSSIGGTGLC